jgi:3-phenylpropionate/trans-cinnamate dioxygenase ferredoxin reductase component
MHPIIIVGAGQAAATAIEALRREGYTGSLVLIGDEPLLPYSRPPLSKKYLAGELAEDRLFLKPRSFYDSHNVELRLGARVTSLDAADRSVVLDDGTVLAYDRLLMATGAAPRTVNVAGHDLAGIHYLRSVADVARLRAELRPGARIVIVGGGYIGLEVAATCRALGLEVDVLEMAERVMNRVVAPEVSAFFSAEHARHGVNLATGRLLAGFEGDGAGRCRAVHTLDGGVFPADLVLVGIGATPNAALAEAAGLAVENGIAVDGECRSSDPHIWAVGDCCSQTSVHYGRRIRLESVDNAFEQAKTAAASMVGKPVQHDRIPWFWSDQYDLKLMIVGLNLDYDLGVLRGNPATRSFSYCYLRGDQLLALDAVNQMKDYMAAKKIIQERLRLSPARLADPTVPLREAVA